MKLLSVFLLFIVALQGANAWFMRIDSVGKNHHEEFHSAHPDNGCYEVAPAIINDGGVGGFDWCTTKVHFCSLTLYSDHGCSGHVLGSTYPGNSWYHYPTSVPGRAIKSFKVSGCVYYVLPDTIGSCQ